MNSVCAEVRIRVGKVVEHEKSTRPDLLGSYSCIPSHPPHRSDRHQCRSSQSWRRERQQALRVRTLGAYAPEGLLEVPHQEHRNRDQSGEALLGSSPIGCAVRNSHAPHLPQPRMPCAACARLNRGEMRRRGIPLQDPLEVSVMPDPAPSCVLRVEPNVSQSGECACGVSTPAISKLPYCSLFKFSNGFQEAVSTPNPSLLFKDQPHRCPWPRHALFHTGRNAKFVSYRWLFRVKRIWLSLGPQTVRRQ